MCIFLLEYKSVYHMGCPGKHKAVLRYSTAKECLDIHEWFEVVKRNEDGPLSSANVLRIVSLPMILIFKNVRSPRFQIFTFFTDSYFFLIHFKVLGLYIQGSCFSKHLHRINYQLIIFKSPYNKNRGSKF